MFFEQSTDKESKHRTEIEIGNRPRVSPRKVGHCASEARENRKSCNIHLRGRDDLGIEL